MHAAEAYGNGVKLNYIHPPPPLGFYQKSSTDPSKR